MRAKSQLPSDDQRERERKTSQFATLGQLPFRLRTTFKVDDVFGLYGPLLVWQSLSCARPIQRPSSAIHKVVFVCTFVFLCVIHFYVLL